MTNSEKEMENKPEDGVYVYVSVILITSKKFDIILLIITAKRFHSRCQQTCTFVGTKEKCLHEKRVQLPQHWFGAPT